MPYAVHAILTDPCIPVQSEQRQHERQTIVDQTPFAFSARMWSRSCHTIKRSDALCFQRPYVVPQLGVRARLAHQGAAEGGCAV